MTERKNAEVIKAWADGEIIQWTNDGLIWFNFDNNANWGPWDAEAVFYDWRIKPKEPVTETKYAPVGVFEHSGKQLHFIGSCSEHLTEDEYIRDYLDQDWKVIAHLRLTTDAETGKVLSVELVED